MDEGQAMQMPAAAAETGASMDLERVFRDHHGLVFRTAYRITGNSGDAEDVLQTVFLRLLRRPAEARTVEDLESYLRRAAVNAALDLLRRRQTAPSVPLEELEPVLPASAHLSPDRALASGELRRWLRETVARFSPRTAEMFALRFFEGRSNPEIAQLMETSQGTVAVTLSRARERIQREFEAYFGGSHAPRR